MITLADCKFVRLIPELAIKSFDCNDHDLNDFLLQDAKKFLSQLFAVTYLYEYGDDTVAFFCVSNDVVSYNETIIKRNFWNRFLRNIPNEKRRMKSLPAVKIGRLGIDQKYQGEKIGTQLIDTIKMSFITQNKTGCRYLTVDAYNKPDVLRFYQQNSFEFFTENDKNYETRLMYFDLIRLASYLK